MDRYQQQRQWKRQESVKREHLRPLRTAVNTALRNAGIPHEHTSYSSRVKGWPISWTFGYETESDTYASCVTVRINQGKGQSDDEYNTLKQVAWDALVGKFEVITEGGVWVVSGINSADKTA